MTIQGILSILIKTSVMFFAKSLIQYLSEILNFSYNYEEEKYVVCEKCQSKFILKILIDPHKCPLCGSTV